MAICLKVCRTWTTLNKRRTDNINKHGLTCFSDQHKQGRRLCCWQQGQEGPFWKNSFNTLEEAQHVKHVKHFEAIASMLEAIASRLEAMGWRPSLVGWRPTLVGWRPSLVGWRPSLQGWWPFPLDIKVIFYNSNEFSNSNSIANIVPSSTARSP